MRIITFTSSDGFSGGVRQAMYQTDGFREMGLESYLCAPKTSPLLSIGKEYYIAFPENTKDYKQKIESLFDLEKKNIVHGFHNKGVKLASYWGLFWDQKKVACVGHRGIISMPRNPLPYWSSGLRKVFPNSFACAHSLRFHCGKSKIQVIPNALPKERSTPLFSKEATYAEYKLAKDKRYIIYIGNSNPIKGLSVLLEAYHALQPANVELLLLGTHIHDVPKEYTYLVEQNKAHCFSYVAHVADLLQIADIFVFPSLSFDSAPNTLLEAISLGKACIASKVGGAEEILGDNGILIEKNQPELLKNAIQHLLEDNNLLKEYEIKALQRSSYFTVENRCSLLLEEYRKLF